MTCQIDALKRKKKTQVSTEKYPQVMVATQMF